MDNLTIGIFSFIIVATIVIFITVYKVVKNQPKPNETAQGVNELARIKKALQDEYSSAGLIEQSINRYIELSSMNGLSKQELNVVLNMLLLFFKHPNCNAKLFADVQMQLIRTYPSYKYQFEALGEKAISDRKKRK